MTKLLTSKISAIRYQQKLHGETDWVISEDMNLYKLLVELSQQPENTEIKKKILISLPEDTYPHDRLLVAPSGIRPNSYSIFIYKKWGNRYPDNDEMTNTRLQYLGEEDSKKTREYTIYDSAGLH